MKGESTPDKFLNTLDLPNFFLIHNLRGIPEKKLTSFHKEAIIYVVTYIILEEAGS